jgi:hypothetical protein
MRRQGGSESHTRIFRRPPKVTCNTTIAAQPVTRNRACSGERPGSQGRLGVRQIVNDNEDIPLWLHDAEWLRDRVTFSKVASTSPTALVIS